MKKQMRAFGLFFLVSLSFAQSGWSDCHEFEGDEKQFCLAWKAVESNQDCKGEPLEELGEEVCLALDQIVQGRDCFELENQSTCDSILRGLKRPEADCNLLSYDDPVFCEFGRYLAKNHYRVVEMYHVNRIRTTVREALSNAVQGLGSFSHLSSKMKEKVSFLSLKTIPVIRKKYPVSRFTTESDLVLLMGKIVQFVEKNRKTLNTQPGFHDRGSSASKDQPIDLHVRSGGKITVVLRSLFAQIPIKLAPMGEGASKNAYLAFDYDSGELQVWMERSNFSIGEMEYVDQKGEFIREAELMKLVSMTTSYVAKPAEVSETTVSSEPHLSLIQPYYPMDLRAFIKLFYSEPAIETFNGISKKELGVRVAYQLLDALRAVHENGIHHLDVRAENIFVEPEEQGGGVRVYLADFGVAQDRLNRNPFYLEAKDVRGCSDYYPPEYCVAVDKGDRKMLENLNNGSKSDIWALGLLLYEFLWNPKVADDSFDSVLKVSTYNDLRHRLGIKTDKLSLAEDHTLKHLILGLLNPNFEGRLDSKQAFELIKTIHENEMSHPRSRFHFMP